MQRCSTICTRLQLGGEKEVIKNMFQLSREEDEALFFHHDEAIIKVLGIRDTYQWLKDF
jgi:hypothetical protein